MTLGILIFIFVILIVALIAAHILEAIQYARFVGAVYTFNETARQTREAFTVLAETVNTNADTLEEVAKEVERLTNSELKMMQPIDIA
jgi:methyl-accepting chemotaxis protein